LRLGGVDWAVRDDLVVGSIRDNARGWSLRHVVPRGAPADPRVLNDPLQLIRRLCLPGFGSGAARVKYEATVEREVGRDGCLPGRRESGSLERRGRSAAPGRSVGSTWPVWRHRAPRIRSRPRTAVSSSRASLRQDRHRRRDNPVFGPAPRSSIAGRPSPNELQSENLRPGHLNVSKSSHIRILVMVGPDHFIDLMRTGVLVGTAGGRTPLSNNRGSIGRNQASHFFLADAPSG
jgi:hypothetical protein